MPRRRFGRARRGYVVVMRIGSVVLVVWLLIGVLATFQRGYLAGENAGCAKVGTIAVTVLAGPLNYVGVNPRVRDCDLPEPSR